MIYPLSRDQAFCLQSLGSDAMAAMVASLPDLTTAGFVYRFIVISGFLSSYVRPDASCRPPRGPLADESLRLAAGVRPGTAFGKRRYSDGRPRRFPEKSGRPRRSPVCPTLPLLVSHIASLSSPDLFRPDFYRRMSDRTLSAVSPLRALGRRKSVPGGRCPPGDGIRQEAVFGWPPRRLVRMPRGLRVSAYRRRHRGDLREPARFGDTWPDVFFHCPPPVVRSTVAPPRKVTATVNIPKNRYLLHGSSSRMNVAG